MNNLKLSDAMWCAAESVVNMAAKAGIKTTISAVYNKDNAKELALIANFLKTLAQQSTKVEITVTNN